MEKIILVTGGNRGIGLEICKELAELGHLVILGSRVKNKGEKAVIGFQGNIRVFELDVDQDDSVRAMADEVGNSFGKIDVLINNAGINSQFHSDVQSFARKAGNLVLSHFKTPVNLVKTYLPGLRKTGLFQEDKGASAVSLDFVKRIMETNFYGAWRMIQTCVPLLEKSSDPRIINISSGMGEWASLDGYVPGYRLSKTSLNALTVLFSRELKPKGIKVNAMCPGWVKTDMGGPSAPRSLVQGAETAVWLATETNIPTGRFFKDKKEIPW